MIALRNIGILLAAAFALNCALPKAHADILIEPYLGYAFGKVKGQNSAGEDITNKDSGVTFGGRFGWQQMGLMLGLDYQSGQWTRDTDPKLDVTPSDLGFFVGYNFPILLRAYGEYVFSAQEKVSVNGFSNTYKGSGIKLGVGYTALPLLAIGLEYKANTYDKDNQGVTPPSVKEEIYAVTVSLPLTF